MAIQAHMGEGWQTQFLVAFKDIEVSKNWFRSEAAINLEIRKRTVPSEEEVRFQYFDGGTMQSYLYPTRFSAKVFCRQSATPETCRHDYNIVDDRQGFPLARLKGVDTGEGSFSPKFDYLGMKNDGRSLKIHSATYIDTVIMDAVLGDDASSSKTIYDPAANRLPGLHSGTLAVGSLSI